jgi:hypothetical protein
MIDEDIQRFDISMNDPSSVTEIEGFEQFVDVVTNVVVGELCLPQSEIDPSVSSKRDGRKRRSIYSSAARTNATSQVRFESQGTGSDPRATHG